MILHRDYRRLSTHQRGAVAAAVIAATFVIGAPAQAQVDTPAARAARNSLQVINQRHAASTSWPDAARRLRLEDVAHELRTGDVAEPDALRGAAAEIRRESDPRFREPAFLEFAARLNARAAELKSLPPDQWAAACREQAEKFTPVAPDQLDEARRNAAAAVATLIQQNSAIADVNHAWNRFLSLSRTLELLRSAQSPTDRLSAHRLDQLEIRWQNAPSAWTHPALVEASLALRSYLQLLRASLANETPEAHRAAWLELAALVESTGDRSPARIAEIGRALRGRESLGQGSRLTASTRAALSQPNVIVHVPVDWLQREVAQSIDEPYQVSGNYGGARTTGQGRLHGRVTLDVVTSRAAGEWIVRFRGVSTSRTYASASGVRVRSRATTQVSAEKRFVIDGRGLVPQPATASATAKVVYNRVSASGGPFRRRAATEQAYGRRRRAEADTAAEVRRSLIERLDLEGADLARRFNKTFVTGLRDPLMTGQNTVVDARIVTTREAMRWEYRVAKLDGLAAAAAPVAPAGGGVSILLAASAVQQRGAALLDGQAFTNERLSRAIDDMLGDSASSPASGQEFHAVFAPHACEVNIEGGQLRTRLFVNEFTSGDTRYPPMAVDVSYDVTELGGEVNLVREGGVRVSYLDANDGSDARRLTGRQQTLKSAVQRKLSRVLTPEMRWQPVELPPESDRQALRIARVEAADQWLRIDLTSDSPRFPRAQRSEGDATMTMPPAQSLTESLPLTPFETLMWHDDRPGYPMVCYCESTFTGRIDRAAFEQAVALALPRHPLLASRIDAGARPPRWVAAADAKVSIYWQSAASDYPAHFWQGIDLTDEIGVRFVVHATDQRSRVLMQLHHACVDGVGGLVFLGDVLGYYHQLLGEPLPRSLAKPPENSLLATRGALLPPRAATSPPQATSPPEQPAPNAAWDAVKHAYRFATFRPARIARRASQVKSPTTGDRVEPYAVQTLPRESVHALRSYAVSKGVALNDLLLRDLFLEIESWNRQRRRPWSRRRLRVLMPLSMRTAAHRRLPAANLMSYGFLQRRPDELADPQTLLAGIAWETRGVLQQRLGNLFLGGLEPLVRLGRGFRWSLRLPTCFSTAVLSNLGDPVRRMHCRFPLEGDRIRVGNLILESLYGVPPVRPGTALAIALTAYDGALGFMAVGCPKTLGRAGAAELLGRYLQRLESTARDSVNSQTPHPLQPEVATAVLA